MSSDPAPKSATSAELVIEPNENYSLVLEALEELLATGSYQGRQLAITGKTAFEKVTAELAALTAERDALKAQVAWQNDFVATVERKSKGLQKMLEQYEESKSVEIPRKLANCKHDKP